MRWGPSPKNWGMGVSVLDPRAVGEHSLRPGRAESALLRFREIGERKP